MPATTFFHFPPLCQELVGIAPTSGFFECRAATDQMVDRAARLLTRERAKLVCGRQASLREQPELRCPLHLSGRVRLYATLKSGRLRKLHPETRRLQPRADMSARNSARPARRTSARQERKDRALQASKARHAAPG